MVDIVISKQPKKVTDRDRWEQALSVLKEIETTRPITNNQQAVQAIRDSAKASRAALVSLAKIVRSRLDDV
jgi:hypothetical protein